ncbi:lactococcin 972 family bacteriocin [Sphaerisporangium sp. TRM90804]|uniref:lactococcin 972 family bacteriocin n=1 Tax=Sphaerisporangium sp. TRM90804 TaxID=3031113 RepID=UPI00244AA713|nr:lactococcin 972 family bacteriocin [Sphaerisporangium sp. TRM90804]MDH2428407.1 lactococcin 972 family bacteriocin [Sphaerisporangium sp. TRM90804]
MTVFSRLLLIGVGAALTSAVFVTGANAAVAEPESGSVSHSSSADSPVTTFATEYVGGGTWTYGVNAADVWSDYFHDTKCHGSSAQGAYYQRDWLIAAGYWSEVNIPKASFGNKSYWRNTC